MLYSAEKFQRSNYRKTSQLFIAYERIEYMWWAQIGNGYLERSISYILWCKFLLKCKMINLSELNYPLGMRYAFVSLKHREGNWIPDCPMTCRGLPIYQVNIFIFPDKSLAKPPTSQWWRTRFDSMIRDRINYACISGYLQLLRYRDIIFYFIEILIDRKQKYKRLNLDILGDDKYHAFSSGWGSWKHRQRSTTIFAKWFVSQRLETH